MTAERIPSGVLDLAGSNDGSTANDDDDFSLLKDDSEMSPRDEAPAEIGE